MRVFKLFYNRSARYGLSAILTIILVSGCQHTQTKPDQPAGGDETAETHSDQAQALSLSEILQKLQDGNYDDGQSALETYLEQHPNSTIANRLFEQLTADPESVSYTHLTLPTIYSV